MKRVYIAILISGLFFCNLSAQDGSLWSLEQCIDHAIQNNISLKRQELTTEISRKDFIQSKLNVLPDLNGQMGHDIGSGRVLNRYSYEWLNTDVSQGDLGVGSSFTLFSGLKGYNSIKRAEASYEVSRSNLVILENSITLQVMNGYLDLLRKIKLSEIAQEKVRVTELQVERIGLLLEVGNVSSGELLEVKAQASTEKYNATLAKNSLAIARLNMVHLLNLDPGSSFDIMQPELSDPSLVQIPSIDTVYAEAVTNLPQIKGAKHAITYQEKNLAVARGNLSPELYLRGLYYSNYSDKAINPRELDPYNPVLDYAVPEQVGDNQYRQVTIGVSIPLFNKFQSQTDISKAKISLEDARYNLEDERITLYKEVQKYYTDAVAAYDNYNAAAETFKNSEEAYRYAEEKFKVGTATALELEEARNRLYEAKSIMVSTKFVFIFYSKILDFYQGKEISLN